MVQQYQRAAVANELFESVHAGIPEGLVVFGRILRSGVWTRRSLSLRAHDCAHRVISDQHGIVPGIQPALLDLVGVDAAIRKFPRVEEETRPSLIDVSTREPPVETNTKRL